MRRVVQLVACAWPAVANAEQPHGTYIFDRAEDVVRLNRKDTPSCGKQAPINAATKKTLVVRYFDKIEVDNRAWERAGDYVAPGERRKPDDPVLASDPEGGADQTVIWFSTNRADSIAMFQVLGKRDKKPCIDMWRLTGTFTRARLP